MSKMKLKESDKFPRPNDPNPTTSNANGIILILENLKNGEDPRPRYPIKLETAYKSAPPPASKPPFSSIKLIPKIICAAIIQKPVICTLLEFKKALSFQFEVNLSANSGFCNTDSGKT